MKRSAIGMLLMFAGIGSACGGDDGSAEGTTGSSGDPTEGPTVTGMTSPSSPSSPTTAPSAMSSGPGPSPAGSSSTGVSADSTSSGGDTEAGTDTDTAGLDCDSIPPGPLAAVEVFAPGAVFSMSEDITFDGQGNLVGKSGTEILRVDAAGTEIESWDDPGGTYGLRYRADGELLAAKYMVGEIRAVADGAILAGMLGGVNGLYPDFDGNVWFTNFSVVRRLNPDDSVDPIVEGGDANTANGVILDPERGRLYYTNYGPGLIRSVEIADDGTPGAVSMVASVPGASLDGLSMDACGNLYVVDQGGDGLYRINLDEAGDAVGEPEELIAQFPANVANAVFGAGDGWDEASLYVAGVPGGVYRVEVGVPGAPIPMP